MTRSTANDSYTVDNVGDIIVEAVGEGIDAVSSTVTSVVSDTFHNKFIWLFAPMVSSIGAASVSS
jgi:hypothetical protein